MSIAEMLPEVRSLSRGEKIKLIQLLAQELERDEAEIIESGRDYPMWSPDAAFAAGETMLEVLAENQVPGTIVVQSWAGTNSDKCPTLVVATTI